MVTIMTKRVLFLFIVGLFGFGATNAFAQTVSTAPVGDGSTLVTVSFTGEVFSTTIVGNGVAMPVPHFYQDCKFYPRLGKRCLTKSTGGATFYTQFSGDTTSAAGQCVPTWVYVPYNFGTGGGQYAPTLPIQCVGHLPPTGSFTLTFSVVGSGSLTLADGTVVSIP